MSDDTMAALPAEELLAVVNRVLEHTSSLAGDAQLFADEVRRLRDAGQLSKETARALAWFIYQRQMHSAHSGDFKVMEPIKQLAEEIDSLKREHFPDTQIDPVNVHPRIADIAAGTALPATQEPDVGQDQVDPGTRPARLR